MKIMSIQIGIHTHRNAKPGTEQAKNKNPSHAPMIKTSSPGGNIATKEQNCHQIDYYAIYARPPIYPPAQSAKDITATVERSERQ